MTTTDRPRTTPRPPSRRVRLAAQARRRARRRLLVRVLLGVAAVGLVLFLVFRAGSGGDDTGPGAAGGPRFAVGQPGPGAEAPPIRLPSTQGGTFDLAQYRGRTVLLYFQEGVGCEPCWDQVRDIETRMGELRGLGVDELVTIAGNPLDLLQQKAADEALTTPVLADPELTLGDTYDANQYGMMGTSTYGHSFILIDPDGIIEWRADYGGSPDYTMYVSVDDLVADLRAGLDAGA